MLQLSDPIPEYDTSSTRLTRIHPYPAMVADPLARALVERYVAVGDSFLDPFCGSGRLLIAASSRAALCVGTDVNPLACLLTRAKFCKPKIAVLSRLLGDSNQIAKSKKAPPIVLRGTRKVQWFSPKVLKELGEIVSWINEYDLDSDERLVTAAAFSAAVRDASFISKRSWKLHRLTEEARDAFDASAWHCFRRRLSYCVDEISSAPASLSKSRIFLEDARDLSSRDSDAFRQGPFDVVMTSPPYGDSETTVQYGAASEILLDVVSRLNGLKALLMPGRLIDSNCLGGKLCADGSQTISNGRKYWAGSEASQIGQTVNAFLFDFGTVAEGIAARLKPGGTAVMIVGRRITGGYRLKLDDFARDALEKSGLRLIETFKRRIRNKRIPRKINRYGHSNSDDQQARGGVKTMSEEIILTFRKGVGQRKKNAH